MFTIILTIQYCAQYGLLIIDVTNIYVELIYFSVTISPLIEDNRNLHSTLGYLESNLSWIYRAQVVELNFHA